MHTQRFEISRPPTSDPTLGGTFPPAPLGGLT
jgi:hypothetical protein